MLHRLGGPTPVLLYSTGRGSDPVLAADLFPLSQYAPLVVVSSCRHSFLLAPWGRIYPGHHYSCHNSCSLGLPPSVDGTMLATDPGKRVALKLGLSLSPASPAKLSDPYAVARDKRAW